MKIAEDGEIIYCCDGMKKLYNNLSIAKKFNNEFSCPTIRKLPIHYCMFCGEKTVIPTAIIKMETKYKIKSKNDPFCCEVLRAYAHYEFQKRHVFNKNQKQKQFDWIFSANGYEFNFCPQCGEIINSIKRNKMIKVVHNWRDEYKNE